MGFIFRKSLFTRSKKKRFILTCSWAWSSFSIPENPAPARDNNGSRTFKKSAADGDGLSGAAPASPAQSAAASFASVAAMADLPADDFKCRDFCHPGLFNDEPG